MRKPDYIRRDRENALRKIERARKVYAASMVNKLENAVALAVMRGDPQAEQKFTAALEMAVNSTDFPKVSA